MAQVSVFQKPRGQHILQFSTLRCIKMRISPRWYAVPVNLVLLIILLYLLAFSLKQARVVPDINEGAFVAAAIRRVHFFWSVISSQVLRYQGIQTSVKPALPFLLFSAVFSIRTVQRLPGDEAARLIFRHLGFMHDCLQLLFLVSARFCMLGKR